MPDLDPAKTPWTGQQMSVTTVRTAESWQFFAFVFAAVLTLAYAVMGDLLEGANWHWRGKVALHLTLFGSTWWVFMHNRWVRK